MGDTEQKGGVWQNIYECPKGHREVGISSANIGYDGYMRPFCGKCWVDFVADACPIRKTGEELAGAFRKTEGD